jgi:putative membrane protein
MPPAENKTAAENPNRARDHLANERTFLAWVRTSVAIVVFGFAIGRFAIALRQLARFQGQASKSTGLSVWMGMISIVAGVVMVVAGLVRYRTTRSQLDEGSFEPAGFAVDLVTILTVLFGLALAGYLFYVEKSLGSRAAPATRLIKILCDKSYGKRSGERSGGTS